MGKLSLAILTEPKIEKLPLIVCTTTKGAGDLEVAIGKTVKEMETVGDIHIMYSLRIVYYMPRNAGKINSFIISEKLKK